MHACNNMQQYSQGNQRVCIIHNMIANTLHFMFENRSLCQIQIKNFCGPHISH